MREFATRDEMQRDLSGLLTVDAAGKATVGDEKRFRSEALDRLTWTAVFATDAGLRDEARRLIHAGARALGAVPASIQALYEARGRDEVQGFTVPAVNIRGLTYDVVRALTRTAMKLDCGTFVFEIARSEIGYTFQRPAEYAAVVLAACAREGYRGPVFIQGDHFQANAKEYAKDPGKVMDDLKALIREAVTAGFLNIDIDTSTLVDLAQPTVVEQQRVNFTRAAELAAVVRACQPRGVNVSIGGEIGEVGGKNSTPEEFRVYMDGLNQELGKLGVAPGISKISVQTGTSHGGVVLPDGSVAEVAIDFKVLEEISRLGRKHYGLGGTVQHGASTLPEEAFDHFPPTGTVEIHLATGFQNILLDHQAFPKPLKESMYAWLRTNCAAERRATDSDEQFYYKTRKKGWGPLKRELWSLPEDVRTALMKSVEDKFEILCRKLGVVKTREVVQGCLPPA